MAQRHQHLSHTIAYIAMSVALLTICAWITVPFLISFTMQTFALFLISALLGWKKGVSAVLIYLALGLCGIPVFSGFQSGFSVLFGATGGYLFGFLVAAWIVGFSGERFGYRMLPLLISMSAGLLFCYMFGTGWYLFLYGTGSDGISVWTAIGYCVLPFVIPDLLKLLFAAFLACRIRPVLARSLSS